MKMKYFWVASWLFVIAYTQKIDDRMHIEIETRPPICESRESPQLLLAHRGGVVLIDANLQLTGLLVNTSATGVDYHYEKNLVFWCDDYSHNAVYMKDFDKPTITTFSVSGTWLPVSLAVDWITDKLYVADRLGLKVHVFGLNGGQAVVLDKLAGPSDIALDPFTGLMFVGDDNTVIRANMDGTQAKVIVSEDVIDFSETGVTVDLEAKRLFYCNSLQDHIQSVDYDGNDKVLMIRSPEPNAIRPVRLDLFEGLYWSNSIDKNIGSAVGDWYRTPTIKNLYNTTHYKDLVEPKGLKVFHDAKQKNASNPCREDNGHCSHLCVLTSRNVNPAGFRCICNAGYILASDNKMCIEPKEFLLYTSATKVLGQFLDPIPDNLTDTMYLDVSDDTVFVGLDFDAKNGFIYYTDIVNNALYKINKYGTNKEKILDLSGEVDGLAYDWLANNLYFTEYKKNSTINVLSLNTGAVKKGLIKGLKRPRGIVAYPSRGLIFFTDWGLSAIFRANTDGSDVSMIVDATNGWPNGLAIDYEADRLYWCDSKKKIIQHSNLDGTDIKQISSEYILHPFGIEVHKGYIYFSDWRQRGIVKIYKLSGEGKILAKVQNGGIYNVRVYNKEVQPVMEDRV